MRRLKQERWAGGQASAQSAVRCPTGGATGGRRSAKRKVELKGSPLWRRRRLFDSASQQTRVPNWPPPPADLRAPLHWRPLLWRAAPASWPAQLGASEAQFRLQCAQMKPFIFFFAFGAKKARNSIPAAAARPTDWPQLRRRRRRRARCGKQILGLLLQIERQAN